MHLLHTNNKISLRIKIIMLTISICMASIIICGFIIFYAYITSSSVHVKNDIHFFLDTTTNTVSDKVTFIEDGLLGVRNNNSITNYLHGLNRVGVSTYDPATIQSEFEQSIDIYSNKNTQGLTSPFVTNVYLFLESPSFTNYICKSMYYSYLQEDEALLDQALMLINQDFQHDSQDIKFYMDESSLRLAATLYNHALTPIGTLIYDINPDAIDQMMNRTNNYKDSFWFIFDKDHKILANSNNLGLSSMDQEALINRYDSYVYNYETDSSMYLVRTQQLGMGFGLVTGIPETYISTMLYSSVKVYLYMLLILTPIILLLAFFATYRLTSPLKIVEEKIKLVGEGEFNTKLPDFDSREFSNISTVFNAMTDRIHYLINDVYEKKIVIKESELQFLQAQMNPHFTFNVLNTIALQAKLDGNEQVYQMIHSFSQLTQARLLKDGNEKIKIHQELEYVNFYLYLQKCRFEDKLTYDIHIEDDTLNDLYIPKLSIQPIVENSMVHGIEPNHKGGHIQMNVYSDNSTLFIDVKDNGMGFLDELDDVSPLDIKRFSDGKHNHIGMLNIHKIIQHFYGENYGVSISSRKNHSTSISITMPIDKGEDYV